MCGGGGGAAGVGGSQLARNWRGATKERCNPASATKERCDQPLNHAVAHATVLTTSPPSPMVLLS